MRYLTSIICTLFFLLAYVAFFAELAIYGIAPPAQYIVMFFLLVFVVLVWLAESQNSRDESGTHLGSRIISEHVFFPTIGFVIEGVIALLYFAAWNVPPYIGTSIFKVFLPKGIFIPFFIQLCILVGVIVLWIGNSKANEHSERVDFQQQENRARVLMLNEQLALLKTHIDLDDEQSVRSFRFIERKTESLPLNLSKSKFSFFNKALQQICDVNRESGTAKPEELRKLENAFSMI